MPVPATATMGMPEQMLLDTASPIINSGFDPSSFSSMIESVLGAGMMGVGVLIFTLMPLILLFEFLSYCRVFQKAGIPLWAPLVPIYNIFIHFKVIKKNYWYVLVMLIPFVNIYYGVKFTHCLSKKFGKGGGFTAGLIFLPWIFIPILAWDDSEYEADELVSTSDVVVASDQGIAPAPVGAPLAPIMGPEERTSTLPPVMPSQE